MFGAAPQPPSPRLLRRLAALTRPLVVAADGGAATALAFGCVPDLVLGDFDSLSPRVLAEVRQKGSQVETFPRDKDQIDGQLAVERALARGARRLLLLGFLGGPRVDMAVANVLLLVGCDADITLADEFNEVALVRGGAERAWTPETDEIVSLIPLSGCVDGITTAGLRWPLRDATLMLGETRGVSNEPMGDQPIRVRVESGVLLVTRHLHTLTG